MSRQIKSIVYEIKYHFVFCSRYRRKVLKDDVGERFKELCHEVCDEYKWTILEIDITPDTCYLWLECLPTDRPTDIMARIKSATSRALRHEFDHLNHLESLWTRSFYVSTSDRVLIEDIEVFIKSQKTKS